MIQTPFTRMISGPSSCGKTTFVLNVLDSLKQFDKILWCNAEMNAIPKSLYNYNNLEVKKNIPENFDNVPHNSIIILDDLMLEAYNKNVCELFTKGSHHRNLSIILTTQNVFHQGKYARDISLNCKYLVFFKNPRDQSQIVPLARQIYPENSRDLIRVYKEVTDKIFEVNPQLRKNILKDSNPDLIKALCEVCMNTLNGNMKISNSTKSQLKKYKKTLRCLASPKVKLTRKRKLLIQKGGFLPVLLGSLLAGAVGKLVEHFTQ